MEIKKLENKSVVQQTIDFLTEAILHGDLKPGDKIPTETELAEQLGVARNSIREAVKILVFMGVLEIRRPEGTFVCNGFSDSLIDPMVYGVILNQGDSYEGLMELRAMMEAGVMRLVIDKASDEQIEALRGPLAELKKACETSSPDVTRVFEADNAFHEAIMQAGENLMVEKINNIVRQLTYSTRMDSVGDMIEQDRAMELYQVHEGLFEILRTRDKTNLEEKLGGTYFIPDEETGTEITYREYQEKDRK